MTAVLFPLDGVLSLALLEEYGFTCQYPEPRPGIASVSKIIGLIGSNCMAHLAQKGRAK